MTVWTVEAQPWCASESNYPQHWDFPTFEEAENFFNKFWTAVPSDHHFGWTEEQHTLSLGVKGCSGDLQSYSCGSNSVDPQVVTHKDWSSPTHCQCGDCSYLLHCEEESAALDTN